MPDSYNTVYVLSVQYIAKDCLVSVRVQPQYFKQRWY